MIYNYLIFYIISLYHLIVQITLSKQRYTIEILMHSVINPFVAMTSLIYSIPFHWSIIPVQRLQHFLSPRRYNLILPFIQYVKFLSSCWFFNNPIFTMPAILPYHPDIYNLTHFNACQEIQGLNKHISRIHTQIRFEPV